MYFVGIDWADERHHVCILSDAGKVISRFTIEHRLAGFQQLQSVLETLDAVRISIERPDGLLVDFLVQHGWALYIVTPRTTAARRGRRSKNDKRDAQLLANLLRTADPECRPLYASSPLVQHLKQLVRVFDQLQRDQKRLNNRLIHVLKLYYPIMVGLFRHVYQPLTLNFLKRFPNPDSARAATLEDLTVFFAEQRYNLKSRIPLFYERFQASVAVANTSVGCEYAMLRLVAVLETVNAQLVQTEKDIVQLFQQHPDADWWLQFPGISYLTAARLLAAIGDNRQRFPTANVLQAMAGTVPMTRQSGKQAQVLFRNECSKPLRRAVIDWARNSMRSSAWAKAYFAQQRARGHKEERAYRALANRWLSVLWKLWQSGEVYDAAVHQAHSKLAVPDLTVTKKKRIQAS